MRPGPRLDAALDAHIFGMPIRWRSGPYVTFPIPEGPRPELPYRYGRGQDGVEYHWTLVPRYSSDIAAAWKVVEQMRAVHPMNTDENYQVFARFFNHPLISATIFFQPAPEAAHRIAVAAAEALSLSLKDEP